MTPIEGARIVLGVTGGIAAYKAAELTSRLVQAGADVTVVMTESAQRFVAPLTFETLSRRPVVTDLWERAITREPAHIGLAEWADLLVIAPATANCLGKLANGLADDMLSCLALAVKTPPLLAPAMNDRMVKHPAVKANLSLLKKRGCVIIGPARGRLASGKTGTGRLTDIDAIIAAIESALKLQQST